MGRKKANLKSLEPYWYNPDISLIYEMKFGKEDMMAGDLIKIKHERSIFRFRNLCVNVKTGKEWIDVFDTTLGGWRSFRPDQIMGFYTAKRSRVNKTKNG